MRFRAGRATVIGPVARRQTLDHHCPREGPRKSQEVFVVLMPRYNPRLAAPIGYKHCVGDSSSPASRPPTGGVSAPENIEHLPSRHEQEAFR